MIDLVTRKKIVNKIKGKKQSKGYISLHTIKSLYPEYIKNKSYKAIFKKSNKTMRTEYDEFTEELQNDYNTGKENQPL